MHEKFTILVTGANGQLGKELKAVSANYPQWKFIFCGHHDLDITDENAIHLCFKLQKINAVINAAAYTAVDKAETETEQTFAVNEKAVAYLAQACTTHNALLVHISTDYVFDGTNTTPYLPHEKTRPIGVYGISKWRGEEILKDDCLKKNLKAIVVRTSWVFSEFGNNFVKTMLRLMNERPELKVVADQIGRPTYAFDLADALLKMLQQISLSSADFFKKKELKIYHFANSGETNWHGFASEIARQQGFQGQVNAIATNEFPTPAKRPAYSVLDTSSFENDFKTDIPTWQNALQRCMKQLKK